MHFIKKSCKISCKSLACSYLLLINYSILIFSKRFIVKKIKLFYVYNINTHTIWFLLIFTISSVQSLSCVRLLATPWTAVCQVSLSITNSWSLLTLTSIALVITSNHLILCYPLLLLPSIFPSKTASFTNVFNICRLQAIFHVTLKDLLELQCLILNQVVSINALRNGLNNQIDFIR